MTTPLTLDRRRFLAAAAAAAGAGALALGGCRPKAGSASGRRVRLPYGAFGFPSPFAANGGPGYNQMSLLYDTLLLKDGAGQLLPWLATSVEMSEDHLTHTFELRDNLAWSDGRPLTPADVVFTFDYFAKQILPPPVTIQAPEGIAKVVAVGAKAVAITLERPDVTFSEQVAGAFPIIPEHVWSPIRKAAEAQDVKVLVGSGGYRLASYRGDGDPMLFVARDGYYLGRPYIGRIESIPIDDQFAALRSGATDVASGSNVRADTLAPLLRGSTFGTVDRPGNSTTALYFNLDKRGALADAAFRRACAMAIDRKDIVARIAGGRGRPGNPGFLGPDNPFFADVTQHELDVAGAGQVLDAAGYSVGGNGIRRGPSGPLSFELLVSNDDVPLGEILIAALRRIGVELRLKAVEIGPLLFGAKLFGSYEMAVLIYPGPSAGGPNADPDLLRRLFSSASTPSLTSATGYANPAFDDLADKQQTTFDEVQRRAIVAQMQQLLARDLPVLALYYPETVLAFRKGVLDDWYLTPGQYPTSDANKQLFITGQRTGSTIRPAR